MRVASIAFITLAVGVIIALLAVILYRRRLDRVASGAEHDLHTRVAEPRQVVRSVLICILAIWMLISIVSISSLRTELRDLKQQTDSQYNSLFYQIQSVGEAVSEREAITESYDFHFSDLDPENRTIDMVLNLRLKECKEDTVALVSLGNTVAELSRSGGSFSGRIPVELFRLYEEPPVLSVNTDGIIRSMTLDKCPDGYFGEYLLPMLWAYEDGVKFDYGRKGDLTVSGNMTIVDNGEKIEGIELKSSSVVLELDGRTVKEIPFELKDDGSTAVDISCSVPAEGGQLWVYIRSVTDAGWVIKQSVTCYGEHMSEYSVGDITVTDANGSVLLKTGR